MVTDPDEFVDFDFDESIATRKLVVPPKIRVLGKVYQLPRVMPAKTILLASKLRKQKGKNSGASIGDVISLLETVFEKDNLLQMMEDGIGIDDLGELIGHVHKVYESRNSGNVEAPSE
jgi:hypothetical protein